MEPDLVSAALKALAMSLKDVSDELGVGHDTARSWAVGRRSPSPAHLRKLIELLEAQAGELSEHAATLRAALEGGNDG